MLSSVVLLSSVTDMTNMQKLRRGKIPEEQFKIYRNLWKHRPLTSALPELEKCTELGTAL